MPDTRDCGRGGRHGAADRGDRGWGEDQGDPQRRERCRAAILCRRLPGSRRHPLPERRRPRARVDQGTAVAVPEGMVWHRQLVWFNGFRSSRRPPPVSGSAPAPTTPRC
ncbi:MAG: hypothetical protein E6J00_05665 [Chloroflexi bacterium]|nr:MAG: hypothetical protein E6J00_05665 [Chloroflexota bacterium]